jgi:hypothetical protein
VVCTKDRQEELKLTLNKIFSGDSGPSKFVVVESGTQIFKTKKILAEFALRLPAEVYLLESDFGLPHQRNVALSFIHEHFNVFGLTLIHFLDDDVDVDADYFAACGRAFRDAPFLVALGGQDGQVGISKSSALRRTLLGEPEGQGKIGQSGLVSVPFSTSGFVETEWIAGGSMTLRYNVINEFRFDGKRRMFGEDVDASIKLSRIGIIGISSEARVFHRGVALGKASRFHSAYQSDLFRLGLISILPGRVMRNKVLSSSAILALHAIGSFLTGRGTGWLAESRGHSKFIRDVLLKRATVSDSVPWGWSSLEDEQPGKYRLSFMGSQNTNLDV